MQKADTLIRTKLRLPFTRPKLVSRPRLQEQIAQGLRGSLTLFTAPDPARVSIANVTFEPGASTAWHSHPYGQTLIVTFGSGRVQRWGGPVEEIHPGDVVWIPPKEKHWHGAAPTTAMTHISVAEQVPGKAPTWMEKVSEEQYRGDHTPLASK